MLFFFSKGNFDMNYIVSESSSDNWEWSVPLRSKVPIRMALMYSIKY